MRFLVLGCVLFSSVAAAQAAGDGKAKNPTNKSGMTETSPVLEGEDAPEGRAGEDSGEPAKAGEVDDGEDAAESASAPAPLEEGPPLKLLIPVFRAPKGEISPGELDTITGLVSYQIAKVKRFSVVTDADIKEMLALESKKAAVGCSDDESCINEIADALGADLLLTGQVGRLGTRYVIQLSLIDTGTASIVARAQVQVRNMVTIAVELTRAVHEISAAYGGIPDYEKAVEEQKAAESRTSYASRFSNFATEPDTVMLFAMLAGGLFAAVAPIFWTAPIVQALILWTLGDDIAGRDYPNWWLAIPAGWLTYLAAALVALAASGAGYVSAVVGGGAGIFGGGGLVISGAAIAVVMVFMLEPVVVWWAGTLNAQDTTVFEDEPKDATSAAAATAALSGATPSAAWVRPPERTAIPPLLWRSMGFSRAWVKAGGG